MADAELEPETIFGERGVQTAINISRLALRQVTLAELNENYSIGPGGAISVRFDEASMAAFANPGGKS